jgi:hypothetical protein
MDVVRRFCPPFERFFNPPRPSCRKWPASIVVQTGGDPSGRRCQLQQENDMRVMVIVKANENSEAGVMPPAELFEAMGKYNEELIKAGIMLAADGLQPSSRGVRVHFSGASRTVTDGPFAETKELIAGFWLWQVRSMEEAIEWVRRCPNPHVGESDIEIRPIFSAEDFAALLPPEVASKVKEQDANLRDQLAAKA